MTGAGPLSRDEIRFAARLVHLGLVSREDMEAILRELSAQRALRRDSSLEALLVERGHVEETELPLLGPAAVLPKLPGFRVDRLLGEGGMSRVYRAYPGRSRRPVALKILRPERARNPRAVRRFYREARLLMKLRHPNLVQGLKAGRLRGLHCAVLEYLPGETLLGALEGGRTFGEEEALRIVAQVGRALAYLDRHGIVHRDVKPGNIMRLPDGTVKLFDLGLARAGGEKEPAGTTVGTVHYLAPEQAQSGAVDVRADIYALGVTLYHIVVGKLPFHGETDREILRQHIQATLKNPRGRHAAVTPLLHYFIEKMMAKDPGLRYPQPEALVADVEAHLEARARWTVAAEDRGRGRAGPRRRGPTWRPSR